MNSPEAFPLHWPAGRPRSDSQTWSAFATGHGKALKSLTAELRLLGATQIVISTNVPLRLDGQPRANFTPEDPGVAVYFLLNGQPTCLACDRWKLVAENMWAIAKTIGALRGIERWGSKDAVGSAFRGFAALPPSSWRRVLGFEGEMPSLEHVIERYRILARESHPDRGGDPEKFSEMSAAMADARKELVER